MELSDNELFMLLCIGFNEITSANDYKKISAEVLLKHENEEK